jgi:uncharacterized membrane protein
MKLTWNPPALEVRYFHNGTNKTTDNTQRNDNMADGGMMLGMGVWWLLILIVLVLAIMALVKYLRK